MKGRARFLSRLTSVFFLTLTLLCSFAYFAPASSLPAVAAQSTPPSGSFGFLIDVRLQPQTVDSGTSVLGVMNFDGAGNVNGSVTFQRGSTSAKAAQTTIAPLTGTYTSNPDGAGSLTVTLGGVLTITFATVIADGGQSLQLVATNLAGGDISGSVVGGFARAAHPGSLNGSYAFQLNNSPLPSGTNGVMSFDGAGNVTMAFTSVGVGKDPNQPPVMTGTLTGTYSINPDGSGTVNFPPSPGQSTSSAFGVCHH